MIVSIRCSFTHVFPRRLATAVQGQRNPKETCVRGLATVDPGSQIHHYNKHIANIGKNNKNNKTSKENRNESNNNNNNTKKIGRIKNVNNKNDINNTNKYAKNSKKIKIDKNYSSSDNNYNNNNSDTKNTDEIKNTKDSILTTNNTLENCINENNKVSFDNNSNDNSNSSNIKQEEQQKQEMHTKHIGVLHEDFVDVPKFITLNEKVNKNLLSADVMLNRLVKKTNDTIQDKINYNMKKMISKLEKHGYHAEAFGSGPLGLAAGNSDIDLAIVKTNFPYDDKNKVLVMLRKIKKELNTSGMVIHARIPILKFHDSLSKIDYDIRIWDADEIHKCLSYQNQMLEKHTNLREAVIILKGHLKSRDLNDYSKGGLSSYSLFLMVLNFMQTRQTIPAYAKSLENSKALNSPTLLVLQFCHYYGFVFNSNRVIAQKENIGYWDHADGCGLGFKDRVGYTVSFVPKKPKLCIVDPVFCTIDLSDGKPVKRWNMSSGTNWKTIQKFFRFTYKNFSKGLDAC